MDPLLTQLVSIGEIQTDLFDRSTRERGKTDDGACLDHRTVQVRCTMHFDCSHTERQDCIWNHYSASGGADIVPEKEGKGERH